MESLHPPARRPAHPRIETHHADRTPGGKPMTFTPRVTHVEPGRRLAWLGRLGIPGLFDGAHSFTLEPLDDSHTRLVQSESFTGILVWFSGGLLKKTEAWIPCDERRSAGAPHDDCELIRTVGTIGGPSSGTTTTSRRFE